MYKRQVQTTGPYITDDMFRELGISKEDQTLMTDGLGWEENLIEMGLDLSLIHISVSTRSVRR